MSKLLGCVVLVLTAGVACGEAAGAGKAGAGSGGGGSAGAAGKASVAGSGGSAVGGGGNAAGGGGKVSASGAGGQAISGGSGDEGGGAGNGGMGAGGEGGAAVDARPGCDEAALIELSQLRLVEGAGPGETAVLEVEATNGSSDFVSYNPAKVVCTGDAVAAARDRLVFFGINQGATSTVTLEVDFKESAQAGDVARCTVRGAISGKSPDDCANAQTQSIDVTVE